MDPIGSWPLGTLPAPARRARLDELLATRPAEAAPLLVRAMLDPELEDRAAEVLEEFGEGFLRPLLETMVFSTERWQHEAALEVAGRLEPGWAAGVLERVLDHRDAGARARAVAALRRRGAGGDPEAAAVLDRRGPGAGVPDAAGAGAGGAGAGGDSARPPGPPSFGKNLDRFLARDAPGNAVGSVPPAPVDRPPTRIVCPACRKWTDRGRPLCDHCQAPWQRTAPVAAPGPARPTPRPFTAPRDRHPEPRSFTTREEWIYAFRNGPWIGLLLGGAFIGLGLLLYRNGLRFEFARGIASIGAIILGKTLLDHAFR